MSDTVRLTEEFRGGLLDLTHYGYISIVDEKGKVIYSAGDPEAMVFLPLRFEARAGAARYRASPRRKKYGFYR